MRASGASTGLVMALVVFSLAVQSGAVPQEDETKAPAGRLGSSPPPSMRADRADAWVQHPAYARADAETIRTQVQDILSDPRFASHKTFWQWLTEKLNRWKGPNLPRGVTEVIVWTILIWCLLTLLAILVHLGWTIWLLVRPQKSAPGAEFPPGAESYANASFEQLWERSAELARTGAFRAAVGVLLLALLRRLDTLKVLRFHRSKTNGEYLREYPSRYAGRREFAQFIATFERSVYGGSEVAEPTYNTLNTLAQQVLTDASQEP